ncbi:MAG TPA: hypothetical protein VFC64_00550, partial [Atopostipes sp.]|nr:hypothetical protein [Atopostipes sp.]
ESFFQVAYFHPSLDNPRYCYPYDTLIYSNFKIIRIVPFKGIIFALAYLNWDNETVNNYAQILKEEVF